MPNQKNSTRLNLNAYFYLKAKAAVGDYLILALLMFEPLQFLPTQAVVLELNKYLFVLQLLYYIAPLVVIKLGRNLTVLFSKELKVFSLQVITGYLH